MYTFNDYLTDFPNARRIYNSGKAAYAAYVAYKTYSGLPHSSSSNAPMPALRDYSVRRRIYNPPSPPKSPRRRGPQYPTSSSSKKLRKVRIVRAAPKTPHSHGMLGGKISKQRKVKKSKKYRMRKRGGVNFVVERGKVVTGTESLYIGHTSTPMNTLLRATWVAIFNKLMDKASIQPYGSQNGITFLATTIISVSYKFEGVGITQENYTPGAGSVTGLLFADWAMNNARPWNNNANNANIEFYRVLVADYSSYNANIRSNVEIKLWGTKINYIAKSSLKMQNRTRTGTSTSTDVIDDVPIYGKSYGGKGYGPTYADPTVGTGSISLTADSGFGVIEYAPIVSENGLQEPFDPIELARCRTAGKISIDPGQIKTSVVTDKRSVYFNTLMRMFLPRISLTTAPPKTPGLRVGNYKMYGLEKVMNVDNAVILTLAYECQHNLTLEVKETRTKVVTSYFTSSVV